MADNPTNAGHHCGGLGAVTLFACALMSALMWWGEEPTKLATVACALAVATIALCMVHVAKKFGACIDVDMWLRLIGIRLLAATVLVGVFWYEPDLSHRISALQPDGMGFDPVRWDEMSEEIVVNGGSLADRGGYRHGKEGLIHYTTTIYSVFGVSCIYVAWFNALVATATLLLLAHWLGRHFGAQSQWDLMAYGLLLPEYLWYGSLVLKEVHNGLLFALFLLSFDAVADNKRPIASRLRWSGAMLAALLGVLMFQRMHIVTLATFALAALAVAGAVGRRLRQVSIGVLVMLCALVLEPLVSIDSELISRENEAAIDSVLQASDLYATDSSINTMLIGDSFVHKLLFAAPRTAFLAVTPFPRLDVWSYWGTGQSDWLAMCQTATRISVVMLLLLSPALVAAGVVVFTDPAYAAGRSALIMYVVCLVAMANGAMMFHERWRSSLWPIWLAVVLMGWPSRAKYYWVIPAIALGGLGLFVTLKAIA